MTRRLYVLSYKATPLIYFSPTVTVFVAVLRGRADVTLPGDMADPHPGSRAQRPQHIHKGRTADQHHEATAILKEPLRSRFDQQPHAGAEGERHVHHGVRGRLSLL